MAAARAAPEPWNPEQLFGACDPSPPPLVSLWSDGFSEHVCRFFFAIFLWLQQVYPVCWSRSYTDGEQLQAPHFQRTHSCLLVTLNLCTCHFVQVDLSACRLLCCVAYLAGTLKTLIYTWIQLYNALVVPDIPPHPDTPTAFVFVWVLSTD